MLEYAYFIVRENTTNRIFKNSKINKNFSIIHYKYRISFIICSF